MWGSERRSCSFGSVFLMNLYDMSEDLCGRDRVDAGCSTVMVP